MKFEYLILLIIAFNIVTAVIKKRKADAASRPAPAPRPRDTREEIERGRDSRAPGYRAETRDGEDLEAPARRKGGVGRDLLEQLAKELGMETRPENPGPEVSPYKPEAVPERLAVVSPSPARAPRKVTRPAIVVEPVSASSASSRRRGVELGSVEALRRAFIAREILGRPVSRGRDRR